MLRLPKKHRSSVKFLLNRGIVKSLNRLAALPPRFPFSVYRVPKNGFGISDLGVGKFPIIHC